MVGLKGDNPHSTYSVLFYFNSIMVGLKVLAGGKAIQKKYE